jgi:hypothetical protein
MIGECLGTSGVLFMPAPIDIQSSRSHSGLVVMKACYSTGQYSL